MSATGFARIAATITVMMALIMIAPAQADVRRFTDPRNDTSSSVDIRSVRVDNSTADRSEIVVVVRQEDVRLGDSIDIYFDTRRNDPGPEFSITGFVASEYVMRRQERWKGHGRMVPFRCGYGLRINEQSDRTRAVIERSCLGDPGAIRVAVRVARTDPTVTRDWAKARRTWLRGVRR